MAAAPLGPVRLAPGGQRSPSSTSAKSGFWSLTEAIDTTTGGVRAGPDLLARRRRPPVMTAERRAAADQLLRQPDATAAGVARALGVSRTSLRRYLDQG